MRPSIWQPRGSPGTRDLNIGAVCGNHITDSVTSKDATPSRSRSSERLREENAVLRIQASTSEPPRRQRSRGQVANSRPEPESIYPGTTGYPRSMQLKRQCDRRSQLSNSMRARLGPQEPRRPRPPVAITGQAPRPYVNPVVQNVLPHHDPMVTPVVRNVHSHPAVRLDGRNPPSEPSFGSISKRLDDMLSTPFCSNIFITSPKGIPRTKIFHIRWDQRSFDHIMHYRQLMTLDIGNDALLCKVFPATYKDRPSHGFIAYLPTLLAISGTCPKLLWDNTCAPLDTSRT
ncbi:hypothetical protein CK203_075075 [Vitis vinifera]|uniref:Uncharacterized protein n=1 Tax=Vitis vinifera TaxID=29760 RepID=A0A438F9Q6_VITVI|nr:hypothetical protein CK203_075075 [Vitis vinifera]